MSSVQAAPAPASSHPGPRPQPASTPPPADDSAAGKENTHDSSNLPSGTSSSTKRASWNLDAPVYVPLEGSGPKPQSVGGAQSRGGPPFRPRSLGRRPGRGANRGSPFAPSQYGGPAQVPAYYAVPPVQPVYATVPGEGAYGQPASSVALVYPATQYAAYDPNAMYMAGFSSASNFEQGTVPYVFTDDYDTPVMYNQSQDIDYRTGTESDNQSIAGSIGASSDYTHADSSISYMGSIVTQASMGSGGRQSGPGGGRRIDRNHRGYAAKSNSSASTPPGSQNSSNTEERRMEQRQKQIDYGKNTAGYQRYIAMIPKQRRKRSDPETPKKETKCSKRCWDGLIRQWRRELHAWDPPEGTSEEQTGWDLPGMTQQKPRQSSSPFDPSARPMNMSEPPQPIDTRWSKPLAARNLFDDTPNLTNPGFPSWADFSLDELDQKFARKLRPNETFEGFGLSPPKRDTQYSWAQFDIEKLDEKFGHKLRISEAVEMAWGAVASQNLSDSPFTPSPRSKVLASPFKEPTPVGAHLLSPISKINEVQSHSVLANSTPVKHSPFAPGESRLTPKDRTPGSNRPSSTAARRLAPTAIVDSPGSPMSLYDDDDSIIMIYDPTLASSLPSLTSSGLPSRALSRSATPPGANTPGMNTNLHGIRQGHQSAGSGNSGTNVIGSGVLDVAGLVSPQNALWAGHTHVQHSNGNGGRPPSTPTGTGSNRMPSMLQQQHGLQQRGSPVASGSVGEGLLGGFGGLGLGDERDRTAAMVTPIKNGIGFLDGVW